MGEADQDGAEESVRNIAPGIDAGRIRGNSVRSLQILVQGSVRVCTYRGNHVDGDVLFSWQGYVSWYTAALAAGKLRTNRFDHPEGGVYNIQLFRDTLFQRFQFATANRTFGFWWGDNLPVTG